MRCLIKPGNLKQFNIQDPIIHSLKSEEEIIAHLKNKIVEFYYNGFLYASDEVTENTRNFIKNSSETNFIKTAIAMRKDLWKKRKTKIDRKFIIDE